MRALASAERELERYRYYSRMASNVADLPEVQRTFQSLAGQSLRRATGLDPSAAALVSAER
ncbi:MAG TPA: hypothetical protein VKW08_18955 [Xanthobacteraceae bacterium]|nr:hypothetical protein [Xanthobacteraceae bacterium]